MVIKLCFQKTKLVIVTEFIRFHIMLAMVLAQYIPHTHVS